MICVRASRSQEGWASRMDRVGDIVGGLNERQVKLEFIASLARSQLALARILDSVADITGHSEETARLIGENVNLLVSLQASMAEAVTGVRLRDGGMRKGEPAEPWVSPELRPPLTDRKKERRRANG